MRREALVELLGGDRLQRMTVRGVRARVRTLGAGLLGLVVGLVLVKFLLYAAAAQLFGGTEHALCQWDCEWYVHTIKTWYDPEPRLRPGDDMANWAFFPLFPLLGRVLGLATGLSAFWSGTVVSLLCFTGFAVVSTRYRALTRPRTSPRAWVVLLIVYPFSLYFFMVYTESLYLLLTVLLLLSVRMRDFSGACVTTSLMTAARPTGVLAIPYLVVEAAWRARKAFRRGLASSARVRILANIAFPLALAPLGLALYMAYLYWLTGDALAFSHAQASWQRQFLNPLKSLYWSLNKDDWRYLLDPEMPQSKDYASCYVFVAAAACLWLLTRGLFLEVWLLGATVLLALTTSVDSMPRYVMANPVFLLALGDAADRIRPRSVRAGLAAAGVLLQGFLLYEWFIGSTLLM